MSVLKGDIHVELLENKKGCISFVVRASADLEKYFLTDKFRIEYDKDVEDVSESILYVPVVANLVTLSWATGADLHVPELDETFAGSLEKVKSVMQAWFPGFSFGGRLYAGRLVRNHFGNRGSAQLFTAGIDSLATYARHRDEKPDLVYFGVNRPWDTALDDLVFKEIAGFAQKEGTGLHRIISNMHVKFFDHLRLYADFCGDLTGHSWWANVQHGLSLLSMCAPLTAIRDIQTVYIASSATRAPSHSLDVPWGSHPLVDNSIAWADVKGAHDGESLSRQEKIRYEIKPFIERTGNYPRLVICNEAERGNAINCGRCEKCCRTIVGLALEGIDPNRCGFEVDGRTFGRIRRKLLLRPLHFADTVPGMWKDLQRAIPESIAYDLYGSKKFFEWLRTYELSDIVDKKETFSRRFLMKCLRLGMIP